MTDIEQRLTNVERLVDVILMAHANRMQPLNEKESEYVDAMQKRMGWKGYGILNEKIVMSEALNRHDTLKRELEKLEADYPSLKGK